jgi:hypothetical protein
MYIHIRVVLRIIHCNVPADMASFILCWWQKAHNIVVLNELNLTQGNFSQLATYIFEHTVVLRCKQDNNIIVMARINSIIPHNWNKFYK